MELIVEPDRSAAHKVREHTLDKRLSRRTSIGLRNVTEISTGPMSKVKMVRVGVT